ncbi:MAG: rhomboid family intramembrane serine protease [Candidatus Cryptobacteroides sp.]
MTQYGFNSGMGGFFGRIPATKNLLIVNIIFFIATLINENFMVETFSMFYPTSPSFKLWQPLTYMFMHGGFAHIFVNMWGLVMFGAALEQSIGTKKFLILYFASGFGALFLHTGIQFIQTLAFADGMATGDYSAQMSYLRLIRTPMLGASGAIFGIQAACAMLYPDNVWTLVFPPISLKAKWFIIIFMAIELVTGITGTASGVAHFAHLGGAIVGLLLTWFWRKKGKLWRY